MSASSSGARNTRSIHMGNSRMNRAARPNLDSYFMRSARAAAAAGFNPLGSGGRVRMERRTPTSPPRLTRASDAFAVRYHSSMTSAVRGKGWIGPKEEFGQFSGYHL